MKFFFLITTMIASAVSIYGDASSSEASIYTIPAHPTHASHHHHKTQIPTDKQTATIASLKNHSSSGEVMLIDPIQRSHDIKAAIEFLHTHLPSSKPTVTLANGSTINNIIDVNIMPGGSIIIFKIASLKGSKYQIVNIEEVHAVNE